MRVLKPTGSMWINLGDKYAGAPSGPRGGGVLNPGGSEKFGRSSRIVSEKRLRGDVGHVREKSLIGLPWRYALRCIDDLGLILRAEVIWSKCLSGGTQVYARVDGREKVAMVKDLTRCAPGTVELWTGSKWSTMLRCDPTPPTEGRAASSLAARRARYLGKPIPALAADLEIEFRNGERVGCTPNHKWPTVQGIVRADELTVGDVVPSVRLAAGTAIPAGLDDEMTGWLVGLYIAEGSRSEDMVQISSHVKETERFDRLRAIAEAFDGRFALHHTGGLAATANLSGKVIRAILDTYVGGRTSGDKRLAPACWRRSDQFIRAVLDGYLSGDGHYEAKNDRWVLGFTANDGLATDLRAMAARLGYSVRLRRTVHHFDGREFPGWSGTLYTDPARRKRPDGEIVAIRQSRARQFWNIEIADEPHEFALASGLLTENSNGLPESVTDRVRRSHEQWFHFVRSPRYFAAVDTIREGYEGKPQRRGGTDHQVGEYVGRNKQTLRKQWDEPSAGTNPLGKLPGSVWTVATQPLKVPAELGVDHFAAFPMEWPRRIILGWSPSGICTACGEGRRPVADVQHVKHYAGGSKGVRNGHRRPEDATPRTNPLYTITGEACACPDTTAPTRPSVIVDPFGGTGTTALVAHAYGRHGVSVDMSADYLRLARWRTTDPGQLAAALEVEKPALPVAGQLGLFEVSA
jgi:hypothetical protein